MPAREIPEKNKLYYGDNLAVLRDYIPSLFLLEDGAEVESLRNGLDDLDDSVPGIDLLAQT